MAKIALINDSHVGVKNDNQVFLEQSKDFFENQFFPYLRKHNIKHIIHLGDVLDRRRYVNFKTLDSFRNFFITPIVVEGYDLHVIIGNHDCYNKNNNKVNSVEQVFEGIAKVYVNEPEDVVIDGHSMLFIPWINPENKEISFQKISDSKSQIAMGHLELNGFEVLAGVTHDHGMEESVFEKFECVFTGHFHCKQDNGHVFYLGTQYELTFSDLDLPKGFHIYDTETRKIEYIKNPNKMFFKIIYDGETVVDFSQFKNKMVKVIVKNRGDLTKYEQFIDELHECDACQVSIFEDSIISSGGSDDINYGEDTITVLRQYVDSIQIDEKEKEPLKKLMQELYMEANMKESL